MNCIKVVFWCCWRNAECEAERQYVSVDFHAIRPVLTAWRRRQDLDDPHFAFVQKGKALVHNLTQPVIVVGQVGGRVVNVLHLPDVNSLMLICGVTQRSVC